MGSVTEKMGNTTLMLTKNG